VGKSMPADGQVSLVFRIREPVRWQTQTPSTRVAHSAGSAEDQAVTFLSYGGETVRELSIGLRPRPQHYWTGSA